MSRRKEQETPNPLTPQQTRAKALTCVQRKDMKQCPSEFSAGTASVECDVSRSAQDQARSSHADKRGDANLPKEVCCVSNCLPLRPRNFPQKESHAPSDPEGKRHSAQTVLNNEDQQKMKQRSCKQDVWAGRNVAEMHERKLQKELRRMSAQSWPSRDRLAVFSDVFDDVCEGSPVFGRILREIKADYDLYVNHLMASQSFPHSSMSLDTSLKDLGNDKARQMELEDAEKEVCRLEEEARGALEENKRVQHESQNVPARIGPEDRDTKNTALSRLQHSGTAIGRTDGVQSKRLQVLNMWREIQQLEEELKEKPVSSVTITATERCIKDLKTERMRLIASNDRLKTTSKDLENHINTMLNREKASKATRRMLWDEIHRDLQTDSE